MVNLRDVWADEARDFTPWMAQNPDVLTGALGIDLELEKIEHSVGSFNVDIFGRDLTHGCPLIVENQLEETDHRHLGQLLTYAGGTDALTVVWVVPKFRDEHRQALEYLNNMSDGSARFFGVEMKVLAIDDSPPAPMASLVVEPSNWRSRLQAQKATTGLSTTRLHNLDFWTNYLDYLHAKHPNVTNVKSPQKSSWMSLNFLRKGISVVGALHMRARGLSCEIYIDTHNADENSAIFNYLKNNKEEIEDALGEELQWMPLNGKRACRIRLTRPAKVLRTDKHGEYIKWLAGKQINFIEVFTPYVEALNDGTYVDDDDDVEDLYDGNLSDCCNLGAEDLDGSSDDDGLGEDEF